MPDIDPPAGFEPLFRTSPFLDHLGPFFMRRQEDGSFVVGLRVLPHHANGRGGARFETNADEFLTLNDRSPKRLPRRPGKEQRARRRTWPPPENQISAPIRQFPMLFRHMAAD